MSYVPDRQLIPGTDKNPEYLTFRDKTICDVYKENQLKVLFSKKIKPKK